MEMTEEAYIKKKEEELLQILLKCKKSQKFRTMKKFLYYLRTEKLKDFIPYYWREFLRWLGCYATYTWKQTNNLKPGEVGLDVTYEKISKIWYIFYVKIYTKKSI